MSVYQSYYSDFYGITLSLKSSDSNNSISQFSINLLVLKWLSDKNVITDFVAVNFMAILLYDFFMCCEYKDSKFLPINKL